jgi:hypothetical protein
VSTITNLLFESPLNWSIVAIPVLLVLLVIWRRTGTDLRRNILLLGMAIYVFVLVLQTVIETDREAITRLIQQLAEAVQAPDFDRIEAALDPSYDDGHRTRKTFIPTLRQELSVIRVDHAKVSLPRIQITGDRAVADVSATCDVDVGDQMPRSAMSQWKIKLVKHDGQWFVTSIDCLKIGPYNVGDWGNWHP